MDSNASKKVEYPSLRLATRAIVGIVALALAAGLVMLLVATKPKIAESDADRLKPTVQVFIAQQVPVQRQWQGYGTIEAVDRADVPARVTSIVAEIPDEIREGKTVTQGDVLVRLDADDFQRQVEIDAQRLAEAQAALSQLDLQEARLKVQAELDEKDVALAEAEFERVKRLTDRGAGNQQGLDQSERSLLAARRARENTTEALAAIAPRRIGLQAAVDAQRAALEIAKLNVARCEIRSPLDGVIAAVDIEPGEQVTPGMRVAQVVNLDTVEAPLRIPAAARQSVTLGDTVTLATTNASGLTCQAAVSRINPTDDVQTRTVLVYVEIDQHHLAAGFASRDGTGLLLPGMFVSGAVTAQDAQPRWVVPRRALRDGRLQVVRDGVLISVAADVDFVVEEPFPIFGLPDRQWAVLALGDTPLTQGDHVLASASASLFDGQEVDAKLVTKSKQTTEAQP